MTMVGNFLKIRKKEYVGTFLQVNKQVWKIISYNFFLASDMSINNSFLIWSDFNLVDIAQLESQYKTSWSMTFPPKFQSNKKSSSMLLKSEFIESLASKPQLQVNSESIFHIIKNVRIKQMPWFRKKRI